MINENKQHKDSVFTDLFYSDQCAESSPLVEAVKACIRNGVLKEYLERKGEEELKTIKH